MKPAAKAIVIVAALVVVVLTALIVGAGMRNDGAAANPAVSFKAGKTETRSSMSSTTSSTSSDNACFTADRVWVVVADPRELAQRIGTLLSGQIKEWPWIKEVHVAESSRMPPEGAQAPDLFLRIVLVSFDAEGFLSRSTKTTVTGSLGTAPWNSRHFTHDSTTPPLVLFNWDATVESDSTFTGIRSDRYNDVAREIAGQLAKGMSNQIQQLVDKHPPLPALPTDFYGPFEAVTDFDFLKDVQATRVCSYHGLLTHNETFWRFETTTNPVPQLQHIAARLEAGGWRLDSTDLANGMSYYIEGRRNEDRLEIFRLRHDRMNLSFPERPETNVEFIVHYRKPFSRAEREAAVDKLFAEQRPIETLLPFSHGFSPEQQKRFYELVEKAPATSPSACVRVAEGYLHRKDTNAALKMLVRAKALAPTARDPGAVESDIRSALKKISPKRDLELEVTPEVCRELGFIEINSIQKPLEVERDPGQPLILFAVEDRGPRIIALTIRAPQKGVYPWTFVNSQEGSRSTSSSSFNETVRGDWNQTFTVEGRTLRLSARPVDPGNRVKITVSAGS